MYRAKPFGVRMTGIRKWVNLMKKVEGYDKLRGGYYTPDMIADFIVRWIAPTPKKKILEPSCGDGSFIRSIHRNCRVKKKKIPKILGIELDPVEADKARIGSATIVNSDFFTYYEKNIYGKAKFDAIVGNPPFIRSQKFNDAYRTIAFRFMEQEGLHPGRLTNIWIPFLVLSACALTKDGRLGMVIPAEVMQVDYAAEVRNYLSEVFDRLTIVMFKKLLFPGAQQEVVLLLGEKRSNQKGIRTIEIEDASALQTLDVNGAEYEIKDLDHSTEKWTQYHLSNAEIALLRRLRHDERMTAITDLLEVNVGVVSGENDFFLLDAATRESLSLQHSTVPIVGRADQLSGIDFTKLDFDALVAAGKKVFLFLPDDKDVELLDAEDQAYIDFGVSKKYNEGYKCKNRKRWYVVPQAWEPEAFMLRQVHKYPKIVFNDTGAQSTDTLHKIRFLDGVDGRIVAGAFLNSFTLALCEIIGRSYGGGVLTFEPGEVRRLLIPMVNAEQLDFTLIDRLARNKQIEALLEYTDRTLLEFGLGMSYEEVLAIRGIWERLSHRRIGRKRK